MSLEVRHPLPIRALNGVGEFLKRLGFEIAVTQPEKLKQIAVEETGLSDFGAPDFEEGLARVTESLKSDVDLGLLGRLGIRDYLVLALKTRLQREALRRRRPELFATPLTPPLMVLGLPRSGTTLLHRLLSLAPEARALRYFEVRRPIVDGKDDRLAWAYQQYRAFRMLAPGLDAKHFSRPEEPEECIFLFDSSMVSLAFWVAAPVYGYFDWYQKQDQHGPYRQYLEHLQIFQSETPGQRLTLKAPIHTAHVEPILAAIPEVKLVQLHRDPVRVVASVNSLFCTLHRAVARNVDAARMARANLDFLAYGIEKNLAARKALAPNRILDLYYDDLVADPLGVVQSIYEFHGLPFSDEFERRLRTFVAENPQHKHGEHRYANTDFGLSDGAVAERFHDYVTHFPRVRKARAS